MDDDAAVAWRRSPDRERLLSDPFLGAVNLSKLLGQDHRAVQHAGAHENADEPCSSAPPIYSCRLVARDQPLSSLTVFCGENRRIVSRRDT